MGNLADSEFLRKQDGSQKTYELQSKLEQTEQIFQTRRSYDITGLIMVL